VKLTFRDVVVSTEAVDKLLALKPSPLADVSYHIVYSARRINEALADYRETLKTVRENYAEQGQDVPEDKHGEFMADVELLLNKEVEVGIRQISMEMIERSEEKRPGFTIPQDDMYNAWYLFDFLED